MNIQAISEIWASVYFETEAEQEDLACWLMIERGAKGCEIGSLAHGRIAIKASFQSSELSPPAIKDIGARLDEYGLAEALKTFRVDQIKEEDWLNKWKQGFEPISIGKHFVICPPWRKDAYKLEAGQQLIIIDPGMAFGTGLHATTQYCLKAIEKFDLGSNIVDIGTGSGILAIASAMIYPDAQVVALDNNAHAIENAYQNLCLNNVEHQIRLLEGEPAGVLSGKFSTIFSNLTCEDIVALLPIYASLLASKGKIICAGILHDRLCLLEHAAAQYPWRILDQEIAGEWVGLTFCHDTSQM